MAILLGGGFAFLVVRGIPLVRYAIRTQRHVQEAAAREPDAVREWTAAFGDRDEVLASFPKRDDSPAALRLMELARAVEIEMTRPESGERSVMRDPTRVLKEAIKKYADGELGKSEGPVAAPPAAVRDHLEGHRSAVDAIVAHLNGGERVWWRDEVALGPEAPIPNLLGNLQLQRLLVAHALYGAHRGQYEMAERALRASWALNESLRERADVMSQLIGMSIARMQVGLARRIPVGPSEWRRRFATGDDRALLLRALVVQSVAIPGLFAGGSLSERASRTDYLDRKRSVLLLFRDARVSDGPVPGVDALDDDDEAYTEGAIMASIALPNYANLVRRADRLILDRELTDRILTAHEEKFRLGRWPSEMPRLEASRISGGHWVYAVGADGRMSLSFSRELQWEDTSGLILPTRYESH